MDEKQKRMKAALAACTYEMYNHSIMSDSEFDQLCMSIDTSVGTDRPDLDEWFRKEFDPCTGSWVHCHPDLPRLRQIAEALVNG